MIPVMHTSATSETKLAPLMNPSDAEPIGPLPTGEGSIRTSRYTIFIDLPAENAVLLVHGYSGAITRVTPAVAHYLHSRDDADGQGTTAHARAEAPPDALLEQLMRRGFLARLDDDQEIEIEPIRWAHGSSRRR